MEQDKKYTDHDGNLSDHDAACYHQYCGKWGNSFTVRAGSYGSNYGLFVSRRDGSQQKEVNRRAEIDATGTMCNQGIIKGNEKAGLSAWMRLQEKNASL